MNTKRVRTALLASVLASVSAVALIAQRASDPAAWGTGSEATPQLLGGDSVPDLVVSPGTGSVVTRVFDGASLADLGGGFPFGPGFGGSVRTAAGELSGDTTPDILVAMGSGGSLVQLYNGATIALIGSGFPFGPGFAGGVSLAVGDLNGDGRADIVTGQASGGGRVNVFSGINYALLLSQAPFGAGYSGGVNVAAGDADGDGRVELFVAQATGGTVAVISGATQTVIASGAPYGYLPGGVFVAAGDVNGDGRAEVITAPGSGSSPILVYDIASLTLVGSFAPYGTTAPGGVRVAATDLTGDNRADIITVPGPGREPELKIFSGATFGLLATQLAYPAGYQGGVFVSSPAARSGSVPPPAGAPGPPIGLDFTVLGANVELRWNPPTSGGVPTNYRLDVGSARGLSDLVSFNVGNVTRAVVTAPAGVFFVRVVATNAWGAGPPSNEVVVVTSPTLGTGEFSATLTWDTQTDIDLHVVEPSGFLVFYRDTHRRGPTAVLDADNTLGYGPENIFTDRPAAAGTYEVYVVPYAGQPDRWPTTARVTVRTNVGTPAEDYRVFTRTFTEANTVVGQNVARVTFPGGVITEVTGPRNVIYPDEPGRGAPARATSKP